MMPGMLRAAVSAGTALLFEGRCWHTSLLNTSGIDRLAVFLCAITADSVKVFKSKPNRIHLLVT